jgi:1,4-dihydroxy-6-naphthoate synthase
MLAGAWRNCGPLLISKRAISRDEVEHGGSEIAIPGKYTTAHFLLSLAFPGARNKTEMLFSDIERALLDGTVDAGLIIHENRFTYAAKGLKKIIDLGEYWEAENRRRDSARRHRRQSRAAAGCAPEVNRVMRRSVEYAFANRTASLPFVREHAQEMSEDVHVPAHRPVRERVLSRPWTGRAAGSRVLFERAKALASFPVAPRISSSARECLVPMALATFAMMW